MTDESAMMLQVNFKSGKPVYLQVVDQIKSAAASGALHVGESLPSIRPLAEELRLNRNTVAKAYTELESQGIIETLPGKGGSSAARTSGEASRRKAVVIMPESYHSRGGCGGRLTKAPK